MTVDIHAGSFTTLDRKFVCAYGSDIGVSDMYVPEGKVGIQTVNGLTIPVRYWPTESKEKCMEYIFCLRLRAKKFYKDND